MKKDKLIVFIFERLGPFGGAEKAFITLANTYNALEKDSRIKILSFEPASVESFYDISSEIKWKKIEWESSKSNSLISKFIPFRFIKRCMTLKEELKKDKPDAVISFVNFTNIFSILVCRLLHIPVIVSERSNPLKKRLPLRWEWIKKISYYFSNHIVVQTESVRKCYPLCLQKKMTSIPNPVLDPSGCDKISKEPFLKPFILSVGRLRYVKGYDLLISAFKNLVPNFPDIKLVIIGEGNEREALEKKIDDLNLTKKVLLPGKSKEPEAFMQESEIFVLSSRWEGFPNVLGEAMANGMAVIAFDCDFGPGEIIRHEKDGILVEKENVEALSKCLKSLIENSEKRTSLGKKAKEVVARFKVENIVSEWKTLIDKVCEK